MIKGVYCVRDNLTGFITPVVADSDDIAKRNFSVVLQNSDNPISFCPSDYDLYKIGEFDDKSGQLNNIDNVLICRAVDFVKE